MNWPVCWMLTGRVPQRPRRPRTGRLQARSEHDVDSAARGGTPVVVRAAHNHISHRVPVEVPRRRDGVAHRIFGCFAKYSEVAVAERQRARHGAVEHCSSACVACRLPVAGCRDPHVYASVPGHVRVGRNRPAQIIARIVDGSKFSPFKPEWGESIVTGFADIWGHQVGIIANNGIIFSESALKATHFIELCEQRRIPLLFLQNTSGYMVGRDSEVSGIAKNGAKMVAAVANATVPKYTVLIGGSYGAGNYGMCGRGFNPRMLFAWPNSRIATMAADTAETVLVDIRLAGMKGAETTDEEIAALRAEVRGQYETQSDPYYATSRLWDDGLIDPVDTRDALGLCLAVAARQPEPEAGPGVVYRM